MEAIEIRCKTLEADLEQAQHQKFTAEETINKYKEQVRLYV